MDCVKELEERDRNKTNCQGEKDFLGKDGRKDIEEGGKHEMRQPIWENRDVQLPNITHCIILVLVILFQYERVVNVARPIL